MIELGGRDYEGQKHITVVGKSHCLRREGNKENWEAEHKNQGMEIPFLVI